MAASHVAELACWTFDEWYEYARTRFSLKQRIFSLRVRDTERFIDNDATLAIEWAKANANGKTLRLNILPCSATSSRHTSSPTNRH